MPILSLDEAKTWLRVDKDDEDETIQMLIGAATPPVPTPISPLIAVVC